MSTIPTTVAEKTFSGPMFDEIRAVFPKAKFFEVYVIADACGDVSTEAHERAIERMVQAGARPMTSVQYLLELQRDWVRSETYEATTGAAKTFAGAYGLGLIYAKAMLGPHASEAGGAA